MRKSRPNMFSTDGGTVMWGLRVLIMMLVMAVGWWLADLDARVKSKVSIRELESLLTPIQDDLREIKRDMKRLFSPWGQP